MDGDDNEWVLSWDALCHHCEYSLSHLMPDNARFLAERMVSISRWKYAAASASSRGATADSDYGSMAMLVSEWKGRIWRSGYLLALSYYRCCDPQNARSSLIDLSNEMPGTCPPDCSLLLAQCCYDCGRYVEGVEVLVPGDEESSLPRIRTYKPLDGPQYLTFVSVPPVLPTGGPGLHLLGKLLLKLKQPAQAEKCFLQSLQLDNLMWCSFEELCKLGYKGDPTLLLVHNSGTPNPIKTFSIAPQGNTASSTCAFVSPIDFAKLVSSQMIQTNTCNISGIPSVTPTVSRPTPETTSSLLKQSESYTPIPLQLLSTTQDSHSLTCTIPNTPAPLPPSTFSLISPAVASPPLSLQLPPQQANTMKKAQCHETEKICQPQFPDVPSLHPFHISDTPCHDPSSDKPFLHSKALPSALMKVLMSLASSYWLLSKYRCEEFLQVIYSLSEEHTNTPWVLSQIGKAYFELADYKNALQVFSKLHSKYPHYLNGMEFYSTLLWLTKKNVELENLSHELVTRSPSAPQSWCTLGNFSSLCNDHNKAIKNFTKAYKLDDNFGYACTLLGHEYLLLEDYDKAYEWFSKAVSLNDGDYRGWYGLGFINLQKTGNCKEAEYYFTRALSIFSSNPSLQTYLAISQYQQGNKTKALDCLSNVVARDPLYILARLMRSVVLIELDKLQEARTELEALCRLSPSESHVYHLLSRVHSKLGDTESASEYTAQARVAELGITHNANAAGTMLTKLGYVQAVSGLTTSTGTSPFLPGVVANKLFGTTASSIVVDPSQSQLSFTATDHSLTTHSTTE
ncbi:cell division cycle protein 27-like [Pelomyxa schiedti]|nr:cell division cycle protein 27-like [Pelomyxa schiedti]